MTDAGPDHAPDDNDDPDAIPPDSPARGVLDEEDEAPEPSEPA
jgi:hypothetical protein